MSYIVPILNQIIQNKGFQSQLWINLNTYLLNQTQEIINFYQYMLNKLCENNTEVQLLCLDILDYCMDEGRMELWIKISSKEFLQCLIQILKNNNEEEIQVKILYLIQKWGNNFSDSSIQNFKTIFNSLKLNGILFPSDYKNTYIKYFKTTNDNNSDLIKYTLDPSLYEKKYRRLVIKLGEMALLMKEFNEKIGKDNYNERRIEVLLKDMKHGYKQLNDSINSGKLKDEKLMDLSLNITLELKKTFIEWETKKEKRITHVNQYNINNNENDIFDLFNNNNNNNNINNLDIGNYPQFSNNDINIYVQNNNFNNSNSNDFSKNLSNNNMNTMNNYMNNNINNNINNSSNNTMNNFPNNNMNNFPNNNMNNFLNNNMNNFPNNNMNDLINNNINITNNNNMNNSNNINNYQNNPNNYSININNMINYTSNNMNNNIENFCTKNINQNNGYMGVIGNYNQNTNNNKMNLNNENNSNYYNNNKYNRI